MANSYTLASPEIQATIKMLRKKAGLDKGPEKTAKDYEREINYLKKRIKELEKSEEKKETAYWRESERIENVLRLLTAIHNPNLKRAVSLVIYWDKFSWLPCDIVERMRVHNPRIKAFLDLPRQFGNIRVMEEYIGTKTFADALKYFGYGKESVARAKIQPKRKRSKKSTAKKGAK